MASGNDPCRSGVVTLVKLSSPSAVTRLGNELRNELAGYALHLSGGRVWIVIGARKSPLSFPNAICRNYGLSFTDVATAIRRDSMNVSVGEVRTQTGDMQLRAQNLADTTRLTLSSNRAIRQTANGGGQVRVMDVATVIDGFEQKTKYSRHSTVNPRCCCRSNQDDDMQVVKASQAVKNGSKKLSRVSLWVWTWSCGQITRMCSKIGWN